MANWFDRQGEKITIEEASALFGDNKYKRVARTEIVSATDPKIMKTVSTVWIGLDHNHSGGAPLIFETMVFGEFMADELCQRYSTEKEALDGHREIVATVAATMQDEIVTDL